MDAICLVETSKGPDFDAKSTCRFDTLRLVLKASIPERRHPIETPGIISLAPNTTREAS